MDIHDLLAIVEEVERGPGPGDLDEAPRLDHWWIVLRDAPFLRACGDLSGHPEITDDFVTTSPVLGFDVAGGWMRTRSRWYRLGSALELGPGFDQVDSVPLDAAAIMLGALRSRLREESRTRSL